MCRYALGAVRRLRAILGTRFSPRGRLHVHHPGQRRGSRLCSSGTQQERAERIVTSLAGLLEPSSIAGERDFTGGELKQRSTQREGGSVIDKQPASGLNVANEICRAPAPQRATNTPRPRPLLQFGRSDEGHRPPATATPGSRQRARE